MQDGERIGGWIRQARHMTTRVLVIMRHGKAEQSEEKRDIDRTLTDRGRREARLAGEWLAEQAITPDLVLCSPSHRTRGTWHEVAVGMTSAGGVNAQPTVVYEPELYSGGLNAALDAVRNVDAAATTVLLVGHNPTVSAVSQRLDDAASRASAGLHTSEIAVHTVTTGWADVATASLTATYRPRA
jgi:phosphohistidine phosphatase